MKHSAARDMTRAELLRAARSAVRGARLYLMQPAPMPRHVCEMQAAERILEAFAWREQARALSAAKCAYCGRPAEGNYSVHRDGFCEGPEVELCDACGRDTTPTLEAIWSRISTTRPRRDEAARYVGRR